MIRKNAVESILAERDILISVRNPFVVSRSIQQKDLPCLKKRLLDSNISLACQVRFFYSFTCRENLYLVMEYLNGGDLYSLLRNLGCLEEDVARVYIAEVVRSCFYSGDLLLLPLVKCIISGLFIFFFGRCLLQNIYIHVMQFIVI